jgi:hypothetical protein
VEINENHELSRYVRVVVDRTVDWEARELAGRAIAAIARLNMWLVAKKSGRKIEEGVAEQVVELADQHERAERMWRDYQETGDRSSMLAELRDIVNRLESRLPKE